MFKELLAAEFNPYWKLSETQLNQLESHYVALTRWNERLNLTRIVGQLDAIRFHYCESLFLGYFLPAGRQRIVDIGSGPGFPGIPIAILRPECEVTLVESHQRKSVFLRETARDLPNVRVLAQRAEEIKERFDWMVARAVSPAAVLGLKLASRSALLIGEQGASKLEGESKLIPWGTSRVLFHVKQKREVPRGT